MKSLAPEIRKQLEKAVLQAREISETGARKALEALAVHEPEPYKHFSNEQRLLRRALRAQARQLGDSESQLKKGIYETKHLMEKISYEQWHRLLFARFLFENNLLMSPQHGVPVALEDCEELASSLNLRDGWAVAASFAATELPAIFRADDPAGQVELPVEDRKQLLQLVADLSTEVFTSDDSLGWAYQFWQAKRKDEVNSLGKKIGADELAPVTQLFTEDYMVRFLIDNTIGAWWAAKQLAEKDTTRFGEESELRALVSFPGIDWSYLRFVRDDSGRWMPAASGFQGWPRLSRDLRVLDPCMGSGHFLVSELSILVALRAFEEGLSLQEAVVGVLRDNLFGLELDARCAQIAAFNLALTAWKLAGWQRLPPMNLACSGLAPRTRLETWVDLGKGDSRLRAGMEQLYELFKEGAILGSLINPRRVGGDLFTGQYHELQPLLQKVLEREELRSDEGAHAMAVTAQGLAHAAEILTDRFTLVATNVPYLGRGKQDEALKNHCSRNHPNAKADLATCFIERCMDFCVDGGSISLVTPQNWLFLGTYRKLRERLLGCEQWPFVVKLGSNAFRDMNWWAATTALVCISRRSPLDNDTISGLDASEFKEHAVKSSTLSEGALTRVLQKEQLRNPDARINLDRGTDGPLLLKYAIGVQGLATHDDPRFARAFWEMPNVSRPWYPLVGTVEEPVLYGGRSYLFKWDDGGGEYEEHAHALKAEGRLGGWKSGKEAWGKRGVSVSQMRLLPCTMYTGEFFDHSAASIVPMDPNHLPALWAFCSSIQFRKEVRKVDQALKVTNASLIKVPFDLTHWQHVAAEMFPKGLPKPFSCDPTQWLFDGHPHAADHPLQIAVARLLGYRWPRQTGSTFPDSPALGHDGLESFADPDGIVCITAIKGEEPAAERLRALLGAAYAKEWSAAKQAELLAQVDYASNTLEDWLRNGFFEQHCVLFHHRPFLWHIWDGLKDGFSVLVNYHMLTKANLEKLAYAYLGDWIRRQQAALEAGEAGSDARLRGAKALQGELVKILQGAPPYDIFIRWKSLEQQPVGWEPDLNDGVRVNIRPFMSATDVGKKGAGILRSKPNIKWNKDKGKDVVSAPWHRVFKGERFTDHHLSLEEKRKAREEKAR